MRNILIIILSFFIIHLQSQDVYFDNGCNYSSDDIDGLVSLFDTSEKAEAIISEIINAVPEYRNKDYHFILRIASVANARAASKNGQRYILFNEEFLDNFEINAKTRWAAYSVFAHEIGHHVLKHDLASEDNSQRKRWEFEADYYSGRVLARLGAEHYEALSGIRNFDVAEFSETHPDPTEREKKVEAGFFDERKVINQEKLGSDPVRTTTEISSTAIIEQKVDVVSQTGRSTIMDTGKFKIPLEKKRNRWNKIQKQEAEIDYEKIKIDVYLHPNFYRQAMRICLLSKNKNVAPEVNLPGTINGTGHGIQLKLSPHQIVWSYSMENFSQREVTADKFRAVAYSEAQLPTLPKTGGWVGAYSTVVAGIATFAYGLTERKKAANIYNIYKEIRDPNDLAYLSPKDSRDKRYERANDLHKSSQYISWGGAALVAGGGLWLYDKYRMRHTYKRDFCLLEHRMEWEPILAENSGTELGLRIWF